MKIFQIQFEILDGKCLEKIFKNILKYLGIHKIFCLNFSKKRFNLYKNFEKF